MKAPDKIYIAETPNKLIEIWSDEPIESKPYITEHPYIRKDALLEWCEDWQKELPEGLGASMVHHVLNEVINKIESL